MIVDPSLLSPTERIALLDEVYQPLRAGFPDGQMLVGGEEANLLWGATVDSFARGVWLGTLLCAQATCERTLAGIISLRELPGYGMAAPKGWEKWGLGRIIDHIRQEGWVPAEVLDETAVLCEARKPYGHWRLPFDPGTIGREVADALDAKGWEADPTAIRERILSQKALHAALTALRLYFGDYGRGPFDAS